MKRLGLVLVLLLTVGVAAQEKAELTTPVVVTTAEYEISAIELRRIPRWQLRIAYVDNLGQEFYDMHRDEEAEALIVALNKADLSVKSLERRALEHLIAEGRIPSATISGTPR